MKSRFFSRKDEVILSALTAVIVGGLLYRACDSLIHEKDHTVFKKNPVVVIKK